MDNTMRTVIEVIANLGCEYNELYYKDYKNDDPLKRIYSKFFLTSSTVKNQLIAYLNKRKSLFINSNNVDTPVDKIFYSYQNSIMEDLERYSYKTKRGNILTLVIGSCRQYNIFQDFNDIINGFYILFDTPNMKLDQECRMDEFSLDREEILEFCKTLSEIIRNTEEI